MSHFEYLTIANSMIVALSITRLLEGFFYSMRASNRSWIHLFWISHTLFAGFSMWWSAWTTVVVSWSFPLFLAGLAQPIVLFAQSVALVPRNPDSVTSWNDYFYENVRFYFLAKACWAFNTIVVTTLIIESGSWPLWIGLGVAGTVYTAVAFTQSRRAHVATIIFALSLAAIVVVPDVLSIE